MQRTENFNLGLWEGTDYPNYTMPNENMNTIDRELETITTNLSTMKETVDTFPNEVQTLKAELTTETTEREIADTELSERITENANGIESVDSRCDALETISTRNANAIASLNNSVINLNKQVNTTAIFYADALTTSYGTTQKNLNLIESAITPTFINENTKSLESGTYLVEVQELALYNSNYNQNRSWLDDEFKINVSENGYYPLTLSKVVDVTTGSVAVPYLCYNPTATETYSKNIVMRITKL